MLSFLEKNIELTLWFVMSSFYAHTFYIIVIICITFLQSTFLTKHCTHFL